MRSIFNQTVHINSYMMVSDSNTTLICSISEKVFNERRLVNSFAICHRFIHVFLK